MSIKYSALITFTTIFVLMIGVLIGYTVTFSFTTEKLIEVPVITETFIEVEKIVTIPIITEKLVEVEKEINIQMPPQIQAEHGPNLVLPEDGKVPISRWVDPQNLNIIYTVPNGYHAIVIPMGMSVPDPWFQLLLTDYVSKHPEGLSNEFIDWMPRDWLKVILPGELKYRLTENTDTLIPPNNNVFVP